MSILTSTRPDVKLSIKGLDYSVSKLDPGEEGTAAFRLDKLSGEGVYDVVRTHQGIVKCDCPDYECRKAGTASLCKHGKALVEAGYLDKPAPIANPSPVLVAIKPAVAPVTSADRKRASYFGLRIPASAPMVVEAPAPEPVAPAVEPTAEPEAPAVNPRDGWPAWTDEGFWTITPEPEPAPEIGLTSFATLAPAKVEAPASEPANDGHLVCSDCGSDLSLEISGWTCFDCEDRQRQEQLHPTGPEPRPTRKPRFQPTPEMEIEALGYDLGNSGENAQAPAGRPFSELVAFYTGFLEGRADLEAEYGDWLDELAAEQDRMDEAFASPLDTWHPAELAQAASHSGHPA